MIGFIAIVALFFIILLILVSCLKIVPQSFTYVIERLGTYVGTWNTGIHFLIPFIDKIAKKVSMKERVLDFEPQPVITKDNVTMMIDTVIYFQITDSKLFTYGAEDPLRALENLSATTLRNLIGELNLDDTLTSRDTINNKLRSILDVATDPWGIKVNRVEVKNIIPPEPIRAAMEKQMKAEREKRESILIAEGQKQSAILVAEGKKQSAILEAEALKEAAIMKAEGEARAILEINKAKAEGIKMLKDAGADATVVKLKSLETFEKVSDGQSTKIIIPSDLQNMAGLVTTVKELAKK